MSLKSKIAVVTGGGRGIGRAVSVQLARDGAAVAVWELDEKGACETVALIESEGGRAVACVGDAASATGIEAALARTRDKLGAPTILVNNAGITSFTPFAKVTEEALDRMLAINLKGPFLCTQRLLPDMLAAGAGRVINISSSSAQTGAKSMSSYVASKGALIGLTKALALELADRGITVNNVAPGFVDTPMLREAPIDVEAFAAGTPMKRPGKPEDIAAACSYLASDAARYITGQTLSVNGGRYML
jgi:2-hydroxycyclohexanecarboxyl-CoA dehydrogenase